MLKLTILLFLIFNLTPKSLAQADQEKLKKIAEMYQQLTKNFKVDSLSPAEVQTKIKNGEKIVFVDVREEKERNISTLPQAISKDEFEKSYEKYAGSTIIVYCTIGYRSGKYCEKFKNLKIYNLSGGVLAWSHSQGEFYKNGKSTTEVHTYSKDWNLLNSHYKAIFE